MFRVIGISKNILFLNYSLKMCHTKSELYFWFLVQHLCTIHISKICFSWTYILHFLQLRDKLTTEGGVSFSSGWTADVAGKSYSTLDSLHMRKLFRKRRHKGAFVCVTFLSSGEIRYTCLFRMPLGRWTDFTQPGERNWAEPEHVCCAEWHLWIPRRSVSGKDSATLWEMRHLESLLV